MWETGNRHAILLRPFSRNHATGECTSQHRTQHHRIAQSALRDKECHRTQHEGTGRHIDVVGALPPRTDVLGIRNQGAICIEEFPPL